MVDDLVHAAEALEDSYLAGEGPWGRLEIVPILISPPTEFIEQYHVETRLLPWRFPDLTREQVAELLRRVGLTEECSAGLLAAASDDLEVRGTRLMPEAEILRGLPATARAQLYQWLAQADPESLQADAFRFRGDSVDEWFRDSPLRPETIELVRPYVYLQGSFLRFADLPSVAPHLPDRAELLRLVKTLGREKTMLVKLHVQRGDDLDGLVEYWGRGRRRKDIRPILESLSHFRRGQVIDIVHLLPPFPRRLLFTYPTPLRGGQDNDLHCFWSAFNFFNDTADDRFQDLRTVGEVLQRDWRLVNGPPLLGDIAMFHQGLDVAYHAAVYLADDLLFSKNGSGPGRPWVVTRLEDLRHFYWRDSPLQVRLFRRNDLI